MAIATVRPIRLKTINPFTLLAKAFEEKREKECLELVAGIYAYLMHNAPSASLKSKWAKEIRARCANPEITGCDFEVKTLKRRGRPTGMYYVSVMSYTKQSLKVSRWKGRAFSAEAYLNYSNTALCMGTDGRNDIIVRRAHQISKNAHGNLHQLIH